VAGYVSPAVESAVRGYLMAHPVADAAEVVGALGERFPSAGALLAESAGFWCEAAARVARADAEGGPGVMVGRGRTTACVGCGRMVETPTLIGAVACHNCGG